MPANIIEAYLKQVSVNRLKSVTTLVSPFVISHICVTFNKPALRETLSVCTSQ